MNPLLASLPDAATAGPPADTAARVFVKCGVHVFDITGTPVELQAATLMAAQKLVDAHAFIALVHNTWPQLEAAARELINACGAG